MSKFEVAAAFVILFLATAIIITMIAAGMKIAADAKIEENEKSVQRRAERLAKQIVKERLDGLQIQVTQRISVIEDDLKRGE